MLKNDTFPIRIFIFSLDYQKQPPEVFCKKDVLRNFTKFTGKHLCQSLFFNKIVGLETLAQVFSCEFCEMSKNIFSIEHLWWLLL